MTGRHGQGAARRERTRPLDAYGMTLPPEPSAARVGSQRGKAPLGLAGRDKLSSGVRRLSCD